jgi:hypothetical protein
VEEDDPIIRSILCSESESDEEIYKLKNEKDKKQMQQQLQQNTKLNNTNKILSDSNNEDENDNDIEDNLDENSLNYSHYPTNNKDAYDKNVSPVDLISTNIDNKKTDLSIFTYETKHQNFRKSEHKLKSKDTNNEILNNEIKNEENTKAENNQIKVKNPENNNDSIIKNESENTLNNKETNNANTGNDNTQNGSKHGRKVKSETSSQNAKEENDKDLLSNTGDSSSTNLPLQQIKRKRKRNNKNSENIDTLITSLSTSSPNSLNEISRTSVSKRGRKTTNINNYGDNYTKKRMIQQNLSNKTLKGSLSQQQYEINNYNGTTAIHPNDYKFVTIDNQGLYINGNDNLLHDPNLLTVATTNTNLSQISTIDNNMVLSVGNNNSLISLQQQNNISKPTTLISTVNNSLPQNTTSRSNTKSNNINVNHTKRSSNGSNTNKPTKKHCSKACINCKRAHLACDTSRPCKRCVSQGRTDCVSVEHKKRGRPKCSPEKKAANALEKKKANTKNANANSITNTNNNNNISNNNNNNSSSSNISNNNIESNNNSTSITTSSRSSVTNNLL